MHETSTPGLPQPSVAFEISSDDSQTVSYDCEKALLMQNKLKNTERKIVFLILAVYYNSFY